MLTIFRIQTLIFHLLNETKLLAAVIEDFFFFLNLNNVVFHCTPSASPWKLANLLETLSFSICIVRVWYSMILTKENRMHKCFKIQVIKYFREEQEVTASIHLHVASRLTQKHLFCHLLLQEAEIVRLSTHQFLPSGIFPSYPICFLP